MGGSQTATRTGGSGETVVLRREGSRVVAEHAMSGASEAGETRADALEALAAALRDADSEGREELLSKLGIDTESTPEWAERL